MKIYMYLTPVGSNTIIKSLALSLLVYVFLILPNPPKKASLKKLKIISFDFVWHGNPKLNVHR